MTLTVADRESLNALAVIAPVESLILFSGKTASAMSKSMMASVNLSTSCKSPYSIPTDRIRSILSMLPAGDVDVKINGTQISFSAKKNVRTTGVVTTDAPFGIDLGEDTEDCIISDPVSFAECIDFASKFVHKDVLSQHNAVYIGMSGCIAKIFASDSRILGFQEYRQKLPLLNRNILIAADHVSAIVRICDGQTNAVLSIGESGKFAVTTKLGRVACCPQPGEYLDLLKMVDNVCAIHSNFSLAPIAEKCVVDLSALKKSISHSANVFARDEFPFVDIKFEAKALRMASYSIKNSDRFDSTLDAESSGEYTVRLSPVLLARCANALSCKSIVIAWNKGGNPKNQPVCLVNSSMTRLTMLTPRFDVQIEEE